MLSYLLPALTVLSSAILIWIVLKRARVEAPFLFEDHRPARLLVDDLGLALERPGDPTRKIRWSEIVAVRIRTTDVGPFAEDVHWEFDSTTTPASLVVPGGAVGIDDLLAVASDRLTGFDYEGVLEAMGSVKNRVFEVWRV